MKCTLLFTTYLLLHSSVFARFDIECGSEVFVTSATKESTYFQDKATDYLYDKNFIVEDDQDTAKYSIELRNTNSVVFKALANSRSFFTGNTDLKSSYNYQVNIIENQSQKRMLLGDISHNELSGTDDYLTKVLSKIPTCVDSQRRSFSVDSHWNSKEKSFKYILSSIDTSNVLFEISVSDKLVTITNSENIETKYQISNNTDSFFVDKFTKEKLSDEEFNSSNMCLQLSNVSDTKSFAVENSHHILLCEDHVSIRSTRLGRLATIPLHHPDTESKLNTGDRNFTQGLIKMLRNVTTKFISMPLD